MQTRPSVTLAISAFDEEKNIKNFLESVINQKEDGFVLERILVISDGSTDKTVQKAKSIKSSKIEIRAHNKRIGKSSRLNGIYTSLKSDILVQSDADVVFSGPNVVRDLIRPLISDRKIGMCGGNSQPVEPKTFTEKAVNCTFQVYQPLRKEIRGGNNKFSADGRLLAYRRDLIKQIYIPPDMIANDAFTFLKCLILGYQYRYVENAVVYFRLPQTLFDQVKQVTRFKASRLRMYRYFPPELVKKEYDIPKIILLKYKLAQFLKHPVLCSYTFVVNLYCAFKSRSKERSLNALWDIARSSKSLFPSQH